jgi:hypothetical protein
MTSGCVSDSVDLSNKTGNLPHKLNIGARSGNHCCCGKALSITYSECVSVTLVMQHALRMYRMVICGMFGCIFSFHNVP